MRRDHMAAHRRHDISDKYGQILKNFFPVPKAVSVVLPPITDCLSTPSSGYWEPGLRGGIYPPILATGKIHIAASADGEIGEFGRKYSKLSLSNLILNGSSLMPVIAKYIPMRQALREVMRPWAAQKGAQLKNTSGRGCAWYAGQSYCYRRYPSWLPRSLCVNWWVECRRTFGRSRLRYGGYSPQSRWIWLPCCHPPKEKS